MPRSESEVRITLSVLDRLIDEEPEQPSDPPRSRSKSLRGLRQSVRRDLEWLLNTRKIAEEIAPDLTELNNSLFAYGLPDFSAANVKSPSDQARMQRVLEAVITRFEPRLEGVAAKLERALDSERALRFRIEARLIVEPAPEPVAFDTTLQLASGEFTVQEE